MFARVTAFKIKPALIEEATARLHQIVPTLRSLEGVRHFSILVNENGAGYTVALVDTEEASDRNVECVADLWTEFADGLETIPTPEGYRVVVAWTGAQGSGEIADLD